jgi:hypothetical protein
MYTGAQRQLAQTKTVQQGANNYNDSDMELEEGKHRSLDHPTTF